MNLVCTLNSDKALAKLLKKPDKISLKERVRKCDFIKGFTLIELLVVIAVIALLMAILTPLSRWSLSRSVYCVENERDVVFRRDFLPSAKCAGKLAFTNSDKFPAECLLMWTHPQQLAFLLTNRVSSRWVPKIDTSRLAQIRGVKRWNHEIVKRAA